MGPAGPLALLPQLQPRGAHLNRELVHERLPALPHAARGLAVLLAPARAAGGRQEPARASAVGPTRRTPHAPRTAGVARPSP
jgi:hypothetical protein